MSDYYTLITTAGQAKLAAFVTGGPSVTLTAMAIGDGNGVVYAPSEAQVALVREVYRAGLSSLGTQAGGIVVAEAIIPANTPDGSARPSGGYTIREAGLYDSTGALIAIAKMPERYKPLPASGASNDMTIRMVLDVGNASGAVQVVIDPAAQVDLSRLLRPAWLTVLSATTTVPPGAPAAGDTYAVPAGASGAWAAKGGLLAQWTGSSWVYAAMPDRHVLRADDTDEIYELVAGLLMPWRATPTVAGPVTLNDLDARYLITTALTKTVGGVGADFPSLVEAYAWVSRYRITSSGSVKFAYLAGTYAYAPGVYTLWHPNGDRISIVGAALVNGGFPALGAFAATGGAAGPRAADAATNLALLAGRFTTRLNLTGATFGFDAIGVVKNLLLVGDGTAGADGIVISRSGNLDTVALHGFGNRGLATSHAAVGLSSVVAVACAQSGLSIESGSAVGTTGPIGGFGCAGSGIYCSGSDLETSSFAICGSGNALQGVVAQSNGVIRTSNTGASFANQNLQSGFLAWDGGKIYADGTSASLNGGAGYFAYEQALVTCRNSAGSGNGGGVGYSASSGSHMVATGGAAGSLSPAANTVGNANSYILV